MKDQERQAIQDAIDRPRDGSGGTAHVISSVTLVPYGVRAAPNAPMYAPVSNTP